MKPAVGLCGDLNSVLKQVSEYSLHYANILMQYTNLMGFLQLKNDNFSGKKM